MNRALALVLLLVGAGAHRADEQPRPAHPWLAPDVQDIVYLGDTRPVLFRLHLHVDDKPYTVFWNDHLKRLFDFLDRDNSGTLDGKEVERMPTAGQLLSQTQNPYFQPGPFGPKLADVDADKSGTVSFEEFTRYYQKNGVAPLRLQAVPTANPQANVLTNLLFAALDTNKDGKLSRAELEAAPGLLRKLDIDDDELLTPAELLNLDPFGTRNRLAVQEQTKVAPVNQQPQLPFLLVPLEDPGERLAKRRQVAKDILARYDRSKNGRLSQEEIGFPKELFAWLKPGESGEIDTTGLLRWLLAMPDVELNVQAGKAEGGKAAVEIVQAERQQIPTVPQRQVAPAVAGVTLGRTNLSVVRLDTPGMRGVVGTTQFYEQQFRQVDQANKGVITAKQLENPQFAFLRSILKLADRNEDDKLTLKELTDYGEVMTGVSDAPIALSFSDSGQNLFELLDTNRDGRLSLRELRQAWNRLRDQDQDGDGQIHKDELPRQCQLTVTRGAAFNISLPQRFQMMQSGAPGFPGTSSAESPAAPLWFRKMDVNGDGDVSAREWLGSPEDFARIDTDGDGLISLEEAIKAEERLKEQRKQKP